MAAFELASVASDELDGILAYVQQESGPASAQRLLADFKDAFQKLADNPRIGRLRDQDAAVEVRSWIVHSYFVLYNARSRPVEITRIVHSARDLDRVLGY